MPKRTRWSAMKKDTISIRKLREQFTVFNKTAGKSVRTVEWYEQKLDLFERYLGADACLADVTVPNVRGFIAELQDRTEKNINNPYTRTLGPLSSSYINGFVRGLRAFSTWLNEDGYTDTNVLKPLKPPKITQKVKEVLSDDEVKRLVAAFDRDEPFGARGFAMIWTILDCGLRAFELCGLRTEDAHLEQGYLKVLGKGNKERIVPIGDSCRDALLRWRDRFRAQFVSGDCPYLFLDSNGEPLTVNALERVLRRAGQRADIPRVHLHLLRHTFATNYLVKEVGDPLRLQSILGHETLEMVRRYVSSANIQRSLLDRRASPMDLIAGARKATPQSRLTQPRRRRGLRVVK